MICARFILLCLFFSTCHAQVCTGFRLGSFSDQALKQQFSAAVFQVGDVGTAYLIDPIGGFLITAAHVLDDLAKAQKPMQVSTAALPSMNLTFTVVALDTKSDIALLQLQNPHSTVATIRPLDIGLTFPDADTKLFVMGYPLYGQQGKPFLRSGSAKLNAISPGGFIEVEHLTAGGNSGGPLLDASGDVIATCDEESENGHIGRYVPTSNTLTVLSSIQVSAKMQQLEKDLLSGAKDASAFKQMLLQPGGPSNLELYIWAKRLKDNPDLIRQLHSILRCPLLPALMERGLPEAVYFFISHLEDQQKAAASLFLARHEYAMKHESVAGKLATTAYELFMAHNDKAGARSALLIRADTEAHDDFWSSAIKSYQQALDLQPDASRDSARVLQALAGAEARTGQNRQAIQHYSQARMVFGHLQDPIGEFESWRGVASVQKLQGDYNASEKSLSSALSVIQGTNRNDLKAVTWYQLGSIQLKKGSIGEAETSFHNVIALAPGTGLAADAQKVLTAPQ